MNVFEQILQQINILDIIQNIIGEQGMKRQGKEYGISPCPFCGHNDCFKVNPSKGVYHCFSCDKSGNAINFVADYRRLEPLEAAKEIARSCALTVDFSSNGKPEKKAEPDIREKIFYEAAAFYREMLLKDDKALEIMKDTRKYSKEFLEKTPLIGYTGNKAGALLNHLRGKYIEKDLLASGLIVKGKDGKLYDFFGTQYFIFFHLIGDQVCDFSVKDALKHQRKKPREMESYRLKVEHRLKNVMFFNQNALNGQELIFVEGQHDVLQLLNTDEKVSAVGDIRALADPEKVNFLRNKMPGKTVYLAFDKDDAGDKYVQKIFENFWGDANLQVLHWERKEAKDIDEYLRRQSDPAGALGELKKHSIEVFKWLLDFTIDEPDDRMATILLLKPFTERFSQVKDDMLVRVALASIKDRFKDQSIHQIIKDNYKKDRYSQEASGASTKYLPYFEKEGIYLKKTGKGEIGISNFTLRISDIVRLDEEIYYRCELTNDQGENVDDVIFNAGDRSNNRKFRERCCSKGAFYFTGNDSDLAGIWQLEESRQHLQKTYYIKHYGEIANDDMWLFENGALKNGRIHKKNDEGFIHIDNRNYKSYDVKVYSGATPKLDFETEYKQEFAQKVADAFHRIMDAKPDGSAESYRGYLFFGALPATIYSRDIYNRFGFFPFLFSYGPSGTGKTQVTSRLFECFGFMASPESWPGATEPGTYQFLQSLCSMPAWYDEFLNDKTFERLLGTIKNVYNRTGSGKGGLDKRTIREVNGTFWLSGEDNPNNEAILSRSVIFRFDPINKYKNEAYQWLTDQKRFLSILARQIILGKTNESVEKYLSNADLIASYIMEYSEKMDFRVAMNHAIFAAGPQVLGIDLPEDFLKYVVQHAQLGYYHKLTESPIYQFFTEVSYLYNRGPGLMRSVKYDPHLNELYVHFPSTIKIIQREMRMRGEQLKVKPDSVRDYLKDLEACVEMSKRVYFGENMHQRCMVFQLDKLPDNIKDIAEFYSYEEPEKENFF